MRLQFSNRQSHVVTPPLQIRRLTAFLIQKAARRMPPTTWGDISLILFDDEAMTQLNRRCFGRNETTDVISFRYGCIPGDPPAHCCGEVIVNAQQARRYGSGRKGGVMRELALYIAHGCDHLTGADDNTRPKRLSMRRRELHWLRLAEKQGLLPHAESPSHRTPGGQPKRHSI
jgi:rRNA maturation RNase YbeY